MKRMMKKIPGYRGYLATPDGKIWSKWRGGNGSQNGPQYEPRLLSLHRSNGVYRSVQLRNSIGEYDSHYVHRLILMTFSGAPERGQEARHLNGNCLDNRIENLQWSSHKDNCQDRIAHGTQTRKGLAGELNGRAKLSTRDVIRIRNLRARGKTLTAIAEQFDISHVLVSRIARGQAWGHVGKGL